MKGLHNISSSQFADDVFGKIGQNFNDVRSAINALEQSGGGSGGGGTSLGLEKVFVNDRVAAYKDSIKVLVLGNSYAMNSLVYIDDFFGQNGAGLESSKYYIKIYRPPGAPLVNWWTYIANNAYTGNEPTSRGSATMGSASTSGIRGEISKDWDIVTIQQNSDNVANYATYEPYITDIISAIRYYCSNKSVKIALHMVWDKSNSGKIDDIIANTQEVCRKNKIDIVIPTGVAIEHARNEFSGNNMLRDGTHLAYGVARYIACCTWYQTIFAPFVGTDLTSLEVLHPLGNTYDSVTESASDTNAVAVTSENMAKCQQCAMAACNDMWNVTTE